MVHRNSIPATVTVEALNEKTTAAKPQCYVDVGFWGGVIPGNQVIRQKIQYDDHNFVE